jgi:mono/diheme cytochrome c family protein
MRRGATGIWLACGLGALALVAALLAWSLGGGSRVSASAVALPPVPGDEPGLRAYAGDPATIAAGRRVYDGLCWNCHGRLGEGGIGPNLRDDWWIGGNDMLDLVAVIRHGRPGTAMQAMGKYYDERQIAAVAAFVASLRGTTGGNGKSPEGQLRPIAW